MKRIVPGILASLLTCAALPAVAQIRITEVAPWSSGNSPVGADWFEVTNFGSATVDITGWRMDDSSANFGNAVAVRGVTSIAPHTSIILIEGNASGSSDAALGIAFTNNWFGGTAPAGLQIGFYAGGPGTGVGLSTDPGDSVVLFNSTGEQQARVNFGASDLVAPFQSVDNAAGLNNTAISQLSLAGMNGAIAVTTVDGGEIGSPAAIPEPETYALMLVGLGLVGAVARRRRAS